MKKTILCILIFIVMPILANVIVEAIAKMITIDMVMTVVYFALGVSMVYLFKEAR